MIKYIYAFKNKLGGFYNSPFIENTKPEDYPEAFKQSLFCGPVENFERLKENEIYFLGSFDNITGVITACCNFVLDCGPVVELVKNLKEVKNE